MGWPWRKRIGLWQQEREAAVREFRAVARLLRSLTPGMGKECGMSSALATATAACTAARTAFEAAQAAGNIPAAADVAAAIAELNSSTADFAGVTPAVSATAAQPAGNSTAT